MCRKRSADILERECNGGTGVGKWNMKQRKNFLTVLRKEFWWRRRRSSKGGRAEEAGARRNDDGGVHTRV